MSQNQNHAFRLGSLLSLVLASGSIAFGAAGAQRSGGALTTELQGESFRAFLKEGFHFNDKAPNQLLWNEKVHKPTVFKPREIVFSSLSPAPNSYRASLYVCDDAVTFCEPHIIEASSSGKASVPQSASRPKDFGQIGKHGFIVGDYTKALEEARRAKKLLLVNFSARWCPGCVRLEKETYGTAAWKKMTGDFVRVKLDTDRLETFPLAEKFKIKGIPTLLVLDSEQNEIDRIYDYQPNDVLERFFGGIKADPTTIADLLKVGETADSETLLRAGKRLVASGRYEEGVALLGKVQPPPNELWPARIELAKQRAEADASSKPQVAKALADAVAAEPASSRSIYWRVELVAELTDRAQAEKLRADGVALADALLRDQAKLKDALKTDQVGEFTGYERLLIAMMKAELVEASKAEEAAVQKAWADAADVGRALRIDPKATGPSMRYLVILNKAKLYEEANRTALALLKEDPGNPEIQRRRLRALIELKKFDEAIRVGRETLNKSYGRNEYWVAESLAKAYLGARKSREARTLAETYLARGDADWKALASTRKSLEEIRDTASKEAAL